VVLVGDPLGPPLRHVGPILFAGVNGFFITQLLGVDEAPDRMVVDLEATRRELGHQTTQREVAIANSSPSQTSCAPDRLWLVATHLTRRGAARLSKSPCLSLSHMRTPPRGMTVPLAQQRQ
jgi:hypothetical protein